MIARRTLPLLLAVVTATALVFAVPPARGADDAANQNWPQWRGPLNTGVSPTADPPTRWGEDKNVKWKVQVPGAGTATPIVWDKYVFIQTAINTGKKVSARADEVPAGQPQLAAAPAQGRRGGRGMGGAPPTETYQFVLICLDRATGRTLWQQVAREEVPHEAHHPDHGFSSYSPVTDGRHVWAYFGSRGLHCYDMQGNLVWQKDFGRMQTKLGFGEGSSPALHGDRLVITWDHEGDDFITALDKNTGKELWRTPRDEETDWSTPLVVEHDGRAQVVTAATRKIRSYDLETGRLLWECGGLGANVIPTPVAADGLVFATSGFRGSALLAIKLGRTGDLTGTDAIAWTHNRSTPYVPSPLLSDGRLYFVGSNNAILTCLDAKTGKPLFNAERVDELEGVYASPVAAAGRVYLVGRNGATAVLKDNGKMEVLATNQLNDRIDASPAVAGRELFLRGHAYLYCIAEGGR
jgi:outer membrane protein assembly factor BamB